MNLDEALMILDSVLAHKSLNTIQEAIFRHTWEGKTYHEIADITSYDAAYIRDVGYKLWQTLSHVFGERVTKNNLQVVFRRHAARLSANFVAGKSQTSSAVSTLGIQTHANQTNSQSIPQHTSQAVPLPTTMPALANASSNLSAIASFPPNSQPMHEVVAADFSTYAARLLDRLARLIGEPIGDRDFHTVLETQAEPSVQLTITLKLSMAES